MSEYARGKHAIAICDICGVRCDYNSLKQIYRAGNPTNILACNYCYDKDHPQLFLGRKPVRDFQGLRNARPDTSRDESRKLFNSVKTIHSPLVVSQGIVRASTWTPTGGSVSRNAALTPYNTMLGDIFIEDTSTGTHGITKIASITPDANVSMSVNVKGGSGYRQYFALRIEDSSDSSPMYTEVFDQNSGGYVGVGAVLGTGVLVSRVITPIKDGWFNYSVVYNLGSGVSSVRYCLYGRDLASTGYTGDGRNCFQYIDEPVVS